MSITPLQGKIADGNGDMTPQMLFWTDAVTRLQIITGSGSPEGVISAEIGQLYMNTAGIAGSILYIKRDGDVGGDASQGWILV